jgi:glyoxylase-like metal-dependent hydrolase (beta-lactamase superfamily II)
LNVLLERFVNGRAQSNAYVYAPGDEGERPALLVDAGVGAGNKVIDLVRAEGLTPQAVILTHGHPDHIWTARQLSDRYEIPAYIHSQDLRWFLVRWPRPRRLSTISDGQRLTAGSFNVDVLHTPGHSRGSVCFIADQLCFSGDTVMSSGIGEWRFPGGSRNALQRSISSKLLPLPDDLQLLPGHGGRTTVGAERELWTSFLRGE